MVNCNPETVSTDYDTADRLYFEPLTFEDVLEVWHAEDRPARRPAARAWSGVIVQLGGQTPLGLAQRLKDAGRADRRHLARSRSTWPRTGARSARCWPEAGLRAPAHGTATSFDEAKAIADEIGYPVLVRPSYVLGGRGMEIVYDDADAARLHRPGHRDLARSTRCWSTGSSTTPSRSTWTRSCDADGEVYLGGIMEHIEEAGIHSGDSSCALPPITLAAVAPGRGARATPRRSPAASACAACSTSSTRSRTTCSTCWRPTRARRGRCRSSPRRPRCRWRRRRPGSCSAPPSPSCAPRGCCRPTGDGGDAAGRRADRGQGGGAAVQAVPHRRRARAWTSCSARR